ncbi:MAG: PCMD domain-containing protein, partial [Muribaculaceae bacterium]|nr:PCMD domain-containing protein [Muribaculaceae bacterium]
MKQVNLYTSSVALKEAGWHPSLDLISATDAQRAAITQLGFEAIGLWKNPGQMAVLDFSGVPSHIGYVENADNVSSFTLSATDLMNKVSEEISFSVKVLPVLLNVSCPQNPRLGDNTIVLEVEYNGSDIAEMLSFQYANERGSWTNFTVVSITGMSDGHYSVVLSTPDDSSNLRVRAVYVNGRTSDTLDVMREVPPFLLKIEDVDVYARSAKATLESETVPAELIAANAVYAVSADGGEFRDIDVVADGALLDISGLAPGTSYILRATAGSEQASVSFETEAAAQLPNSGMEQWTRVDGKTRYWWIDYPGESTSAVWGTMNLLTTSVGNGNTNIFDHKGTSYCAFSGTRYVDNDVHSGSYAAIISTVGWGDNDANGSTSTGKGCKNLTVGELYLGHYDASVQKAVYTGIDFGSRPSEFSFWYKYVHKNSSDFGTAEIVIKDASGNIIATNSVELRAVNSYTQVKLPLDYT